MEVAGLAVAIVAAIAALAAIVYSRRSALSATRSAMASEASAEASRQIAAVETSRRDDEVRRAEEEEQQRRSARLSIRVVREVTLEAAETNLYAHFLEVGNAGPSDAWDVNLEIVSFWSDTGGMLPEFEYGGRHRKIGKIAPGRLERLALAVAENTNYDIGECRLRWRDDAGEHDERTRSLSDWLPRPSGFEG
ncbi:MAG: hypothetical protein CL424_07920 [Acidimicrobiaceae bacterium]|nr:hypothetical protein [Acidimicrobiaceae bacterium]